MAEEISSEEKKETAFKPETDKIVISMFLLTFLMVILTMGAVFREAPQFAEPEYISPQSVAEVLAEELPEESSPETSSEEADPFPININTATSETLQLIPDVGPVTAQRIIDYRDIYGTITEFSQLLSINGIGEKTVKLLEEYCYIG